MILRATFKNILSFNEETSISFVAGKSLTHASHVVRAEKRDDISVLKSGVVYGANASGKSNMIKAINLLKSIALNKKIIKHYIVPFKLADSTDNASMLELEFKCGNQYFAYGTKFSIQGIQEEWLYEINGRTDKIVFSRRVEAQENAFEFGKITGKEETKQFVKFLAQATSPQVSFLSEYVHRNGKGLDDIKAAYNWFNNQLMIIFPETRFRGLMVKVAEDEKFAEATKYLLEYFNTGIVNIGRYPIVKEAVEIPRELLDKVFEELKPKTNIMIASFEGNSIYFFEMDDKGEVKIYQQKTIHTSTSGNEVVFDMYEESDGSIRMLDFIPMLIDLKLNDVVYLIDEIDRSLHPMLSRGVMEIYFNNLSTETNSQLIFSTHECNLLDLSLMRADEVWFVEKNKAGASQLYSLAEFKPREDVRKGYLQGRYGAIPFLGRPDALKW